MSQFVRIVTNHRYWRLVLIAVIALCIPIASSNAASVDSPVRILVTGFEPFGGYKTNPTNELVNYINNIRANELDGVELKAITLPVVYYKSWQRLEQEIEQFRPEYVISFGYAPDSDKFRIESTAKNHDRGYKDNNNQRHWGEIVDGGKNSYLNQFPVTQIKRQLNFKGIPAYISSDAGGYLCNHLFYLERNYTSKVNNIRSGFFHAPKWSVTGEHGLWVITKMIISVIREEKDKGRGITAALKSAG